MRKTAYLLVVVVLACAAPAIAQGPFNDVPTDHWAYDAVNELQRAGIVIGYPDGTYGGKRAMSRYEFAVAIARLLPMVEGITRADLDAILKDYAKKSDLPAPVDGAKPPDTSGLGTKAEVDALRRLVDEFNDELAALGVDVDALKRDVAALAARVDALEAEQRRVRWTGDFNVFAIAASDSGSDITPVDLDERQIVAPNDTLGRTALVVHDFDLNVVGRVSDTITANATINFGNYLNYLTAIDDYVGGQRPIEGIGSTQTIGDLTHEFAADFFPYYAYIDVPMGKGGLQVGRFPIQWTPYTLKKIDVDSYTSILKTDDGNYPVDGAKLACNFGGFDLTLFAAKNDTNDYLVNGLTGQPRAGLYNAFGVFHDAGGNAVGGLTSRVTQTAGGRLTFGGPWKGNVGLTYYQAWARGAFFGGAIYDQARVFGADVTVPLGDTFGVAASWTQSDTLARDGLAAPDIDDDNTAWDAKLTAGFGKVGVGAGYKRIEYNFAAAGAWDKIGRWTNPTNIKGPYADLTWPIGRKLRLVANAELLELIETGGEPGLDITKAEAGLKWGFSKTNSLDLGFQWVQFDPDGAADETEESYLTIGWAHQLSANAGFKIGYQFINYEDNGNDIYGLGDYDGGVGVVQFGVTF